MANAQLVPVTFGLPASGSGITVTPADLPAVAAGATGVFFANNGAMILLINNGAASAITVNTVVQKLTYGEAPAVLGAASNLAAGKMFAFGPFQPSVFNDTNGNVQVNLSSITTVSAAVFQLASLAGT